VNILSHKNCKLQHINRSHLDMVISTKKKSNKQQHPHCPSLTIRGNTHRFLSAHVPESRLEYPLFPFSSEFDERW